MGFRSLVAGLISLTIAAEASAYDWLDNQHACIVENSKFTTADGSRSGNWRNAPKSFFVNITNCRTYAASHGLPFVVNENENDPKYSERIAINQCVRDGGILDYFIVEAKGLKVAFDPEIAFLILKVPLSSGGSVMAFNDDGYIDFSEYGVVDDDGAATWFMLRANCTVLKP